MSKDSIRNRKRLFIRTEKTKVEDLKMPELEWYDQKTWIFKAWKEKWNAEYGGEETSPFYRLFCYDYIYTCNACMKNKKRNFWVKIIWLIFLFLVGVFCMAVTAFQAIALWTKGELFGQFIGENLQQVSSVETSIIITVIILTIVISKWVGIKKYQETWTRHSAHKFEVEIQMFRYISNMGEYGLTEAKKEFINTIMGTWEINQNKFNKNMKKEEKIKDDLEKIIAKL